jgi:hypothetical protein
MRLLDRDDEKSYRGCKQRRTRGVQTSAYNPSAERSYFCLLCELQLKVSAKIASTVPSLSIDSRLADPHTSRKYVKHKASSSVRSGQENLTITTNQEVLATDPQ